ncbi:OLC1v1014673C1 [Oldenlandia corymbosa var. corymbosa]|uniref:OLC1v1014673C1 n=1 Tax=Oldenlandia corymbosa var. corymbosa TaxID=529605 RepID=A0AAV1E1I7_OLDCO|nr:OLC1v1014673C1 [Oldenlandia corymbosa var. corymbosa]
MPVVLPTRSNKRFRAEDSEVLPEQLQWEILKLLPVKSLMRFKGVSVTWYSIINDPAFAKVYGGGSRGLLSYEQNLNGFSSHSTNVYFSPLVGPSSHFSNFIILKKGWRVTNIVNGLVAMSRVGYTDGVLYWWNNYNGAVTEVRDQFLIVCHLHKETFGFIRLMAPDLSNKYHLPKFGPLAMMYPFIGKSGMRQGSVVRHIYRRNPARKVVDNVWVKEDLFVQPSQAFTTVCFEEILPNGKVLISHPDNFPASLYLFDPMKRETQAQEISIEAGPSFPKHVNWSRFVRCYYEENIISLKCLISAPEHYATLGFDSQCPVQYVMPFGI